MNFDSIPSNLRVPFVTAEISNTAAAQGPAQMPYRSLLIGQKTGQGTGVANTLYKVTSANDVLTLGGRGSMLHRMALAYFAANKFTETWIGVLADNSAGVFSTGTITVSGPSTAAGTINLYLGGELVTVAVASGDSANTIASAIASAIGKHATGTITCATAIANNTVTIGTTTFTGATGAVVAGAATFSVDTGNNACATSIAAQINAHATASQLVVATASLAVVTLRAVAGGTTGEVALSSSGSTVAVSGATLSGDSPDTNLAVHASVSSAVVTVYFRHRGAVGNEFDMRANLMDGEVYPAGVSLAFSALASGATNPTLTGLIAALGDSWYHIWANPYTDSTSLTAIENELHDRFGPLRMIDGLCISAKSSTLGGLATLGAARNSPHNCILSAPGDSAVTPPMEFAAHAAGVVAYYGANDPARPFQTLPLTWVKAPAEVDLYTIQERNTLLYEGIATSKVAAGGMVVLDRLITTYQTNAGGAADTSYLDSNTMLNLMYLRYSWRTRVASRYPRHKLASDGVRIGAGQAVVTPKLMKAEALNWFREMESLGLVEGFEQFKQDLVVERNISDPNRLDILLPPDIINQLIVSATKIEFRL